MAAARRGFLTAGTWCLDRNISVDHWPKEDTLAKVQEVALSGGGSACNFALSLRRLDPALPIATIGLLGRDEPGRFLHRAAREADLADGFVWTDQAGTQVTDAYVSQQSGQRTHIAFMGTAPLLTPEHFAFSGSRARTLHLGLPGIHARMDAPWGDDANGWVTVLRRARAAGLETNLELVTIAPALIRALIQPCLAWLTTLVVNDHEAGALASVETSRDGAVDADACGRAAQQILAQGPLEAVAVHFTQGAVLALRDGGLRFCPSVAIPISDMRGANGAGDAFAAGFHYARHEGWPVDDWLSLGHAAAAASLRALDPSSAVVSAADCLALARRYGWRTGRDGSLG